jgi:hypothetical protein
MYFFNRSQDSSVGTVMGYGRTAMESVFDSQQVQEIFLFIAFRQAVRPT